MVAGALILVGMALLAWPALGRPFRMSRPIVRLGVSRWKPRPPELTESRWRWVPPVVVATVVAVAGTLPLAVAAGLASATALTLARRATVSSRSRRDLADVTAALRAVARDLQAGATPASAVTAVARSAPERVATMLTGLRVVAGHAAARAHPHPSGVVLADVWSRLLAGWSLSERQGIPLVAVVSAIADDLADGSRAAESRAGQVAGPAVSGYVLAALPLAGLLLGAGMGADPLQILTSSPLGGALLIAGTLLCCGGLLWADRIVRQ